MKKFTTFAATIAASLFPALALAHHPLGGETPTTMMQGLLSGIGHPVIGLDHLAFVIAVGIAAALIGARMVLPLVFVAATLAGTGIHLATIDLPAVEPVIALSVLLAGGLIAFRTDVPLAVFAALFAIAGLFHGFAYGEAVYGAETTPVVSYLLGFGVTQYAIALLAGCVVVDCMGKSVAAMNNVPARIAGGMVAGAGALMVGEKAIGAVFGA